jgi:large subunit ribosomal protein L21
MDYAVVRIGGTQYKVSAGSIIEVDKLNAQPDEQVVFDDVLLFASNGKTKIGNPRVSGVKVKAKVLEQKKGKKIRVAKFKAKVRYRRVMGFRPLLTKLEITSIDSGAQKIKKAS